VTGNAQGQPQDWQPPQGQPPYGQPPYGPHPYGQQPQGESQYGQPTYPAPHYGQQPYPAPQYGQPQYAPAPYGQPSYGPPAYGSGWPQPQRTWPHGPNRPGLATAAAVLAIVTGVLTVLGGLAFLLASLTEDGDLPTWLLALGLPCGVVLLVGGIRLLGRRSAPLVLWSAVAAAAVLVLALIGGMATLSRYDVPSLVAFILFALPLPVVTAAFAAQRPVRGWVASGG
jgi:hypothetical protein